MLDITCTFINALLPIAIFCISHLLWLVGQVLINLAVNYTSEKVEKLERKFPKRRPVYEVNLPAAGITSKGIQVIDFGDAVYSIRHF